MNRILFIVGAVVILWFSTWFVHVFIKNQQDRNSRFHRADGYTETVQNIINHGWLGYNSKSGHVELTGKAPDAAHKFFNESFLKDDVEKFNTKSRLGIFRIENEQLIAIDPYLHNILLPFTEYSVWEGNLRFRSSRNHHSILKGKNISIELTEHRTRLDRKNDDPKIVLPDINDTEKIARVGDGFKIAGMGNAFIGRLHRIGDHIIFNRRTKDNDIMISVSGETIGKGDRMRIDAGDLVKFKWPRNKTTTNYNLLLNTLSDSSPVISSYRYINGGKKRVPDETDPALGTDIIAAINNVFTTSSKSRNAQRRKRFDLSLTLDARIHEASQKILLEECRKRYRNNHKNLFRAAVTVSDTLTGDILALASYPSRDDLRDFKGSTAQRSRLARNHNLSRLPVGSVAKAIFAAAIVDDAPFLSDLKIAEYGKGKVDNLLGITLSPPLEDHNGWGGDDKMVDFDEFMKFSSNRYAATLLTLSNGIGDDRSGLVPLGGDEIPTRLPKSQYFHVNNKLWKERPWVNIPLKRSRAKKNRVVTSEWTTAEHVGWAQKMEELFDIRCSDTGSLSRHLEPGDGDDFLDADIWKPVFGYLYNEAEQNALKRNPFLYISPERENLSLNLIKNYRTEYLSLILGGGNSVWTNIKVTEIFSRLITGKKIKNRLVMGISDDGTNDAISRTPFDEIPSLKMNQEMRKKVANAMVKVAHPGGGTAAKLHSTLMKYNRELAKKGKVLGFFSKTGSPTNIMNAPTRLSKAVNKLIRERALTYDRRTGMIRYRNIIVDLSGSGETADTALPLKKLKNNKDDMAILKRYRVRPQTVISVCNQFNENVASGGEGKLFEVKNDRLNAFYSVKQTKHIGGTYAFTMGIFDAKAAIGAPGTRLPEIDVTNHVPERAVTVCINVEAQGTSVKVAVPLAKQIITQVLWSSLKNGW